MPHRIRWIFLAVFWLAFSSGLPRAAQEFSNVELGIFAIPRDLEIGLMILPKGELKLFLIKGRRSAIGLATVKPDERGMTQAWSDDAAATDVKENYPQPKVLIDVVTEGGEEFVEIRVFSDNKMYRNLWKCATEPIPPSQREKESGAVDPAVEMEVKLLAEAHLVLDAFAGKIWPGWEGYKALDFTLRFPNLDYVVVTRNERLPRRFKIWPGRAMAGKEVYIDRSKEMPGRIDPGMSINGHGDIAGVRAVLMSRLATDAPPQGTSTPASDAAAERLDVSMRLTRILIYVHEAFHCLQANLQLVAQKGGFVKPMGQQADNDAELDYGVFADIEGQALLRAYRENDPAKALEYFKDAFTARKLKQGTLPEGAAAMEIGRTASEGTSTYSELKMASLMKESGYPGEPAAKDPDVLAALRTVDSYFQDNGILRLEQMASRTLDVGQRFYLYGGFQCLLLDRFLPEWKKDFFEKNRSLDEVIDGFLKLSKEDQSQISQGWESKYGLKALREKHGRVIQDRDEAVRLVTSRKGKKFQIDLRRAQRGFSINPRNQDHVVTFRGDQYFPHGLTKLEFGSLSLVSEDTPMKMAYGSRTLEWIDVEARTGETGYVMTYGGKDGDLYKDVTLKTKGFTMTAKGVRIAEDPGTVTISIVDY
ncbi:MAG: hypothetical protein HGA24_05855 [Candidatus Aminicenantes bacterium]|nr:hypothetical protein [Candidatus Aminicenantes bacterium]